MAQHSHHPHNHNYRHFQDDLISCSNTTNSPPEPPDALTEQTATIPATTTTPHARTYLDVHAHSPLPRVDSTASFAAEACHIEDVNAGCQLHSHPSDIALSHYTVAHGVLLREGQGRPEAEEGQQQHSLYPCDGKKDSQAMEMACNSLVSPRSPTIMTRTPTPPSPPSSNTLGLTPPVSATPMVVPSIQLPYKQGAQGTASSLFLPPPPHQRGSASTPSGSSSPQHSSMDTNWGFDEMGGLLSNETGQLSWQDVSDRANTPPVPPDVVSKPQSELSSDEDEQHPPTSETKLVFDGGGNHGGMNETSHSNDPALLNRQANAKLPEDESQSMLFDSTAGNGSSFFDNMRGELETSTNLQRENVTDLCLGEALHRPEVGNEFVDKVPLAQQSAETTTTTTTTITATITTTNTTSFFDEPQDYEGSDFFSARINGDELPKDPDTLITAQSLIGAQSDTSIVGMETLDSTVSGGDEFFANPVQSAAMIGIVNSDDSATTGGIAAKWEATLDDDFLPDDGEGFLSSDEEIDPSIMTAPQSSKPITTSNTVFDTVPALKYTPQQPTALPSYFQGPYWPPQPSYTPPIPVAKQSQPNPHPQSAIPQPFQYIQSQASSSMPASALTSYYASISTTTPKPFQATTPLKSTTPKAESFVDKEGSYKSPYDLPMDIVKPALSKRTSIPHMSPALTSPPRQDSFGATPPPIMQGAFGPPLHGARPEPTPPPQQLPRTIPKMSSGANPAFFEELPTVTKPKLPTKYQPKAPGGMLPRHSPSAPPPQPISARPTAATLMNTRYAPPPTHQASNKAAPVFTTPSSSGSALPSQYAVLATPPATSSPLAPVPAALPPKQESISSLQTYSYAPLPNNIGGTKSTLDSHQSPPRQRPVSTPPGPAAEREHMTSQQSQHHSPNLARYSPGDHHSHSSRPGTGKSSFAAEFEVLKEEDEVGTSLPTMTSNRYYQRSIATPPSSGSPLRGLSRVAGSFSSPTGTISPGVHSSQQRSSSRTASPESFAPPRRAQTQSPSTLMHGPKNTTAQYQAPQHAPRPASALAGNVIPTVYPDFPSKDQHHHRVSGGVQSFMNDTANFMPPQDDSVHDPLNRWQGCPIFSWGFGGNVVMMFPTRTQRNAIGMSQPVIKCSPGEVKTRQFRDVLLGESLGKFPGPVYTGGKGTKAKKKEALMWITERIQSLERNVAEVGMFSSGEQMPDEGERKRREEKVLLWKGMKIFLENDGIIEGAEIEKSIKSLLWPGDLSSSTEAYQLVTPMNSSSIENSLGPIPERVDADAMKSIKAHLLNGDRTSAVWHAVDKRLWSHAMLMAGTVSKGLWKQVVQDFVKNEIKSLGSGHESLAVLYEVFGGNGEESIDELVPQSARLGQPMMTSAMGTVVAEDPQKGLENWRETLALIISNRSVGDTSAILSLGNLLGTYARVHASHLCYLFAKTPAAFSGPDDPNAAVTLFGADHLCYPFTFWKDTDAILLSEIYELALSLASTPTAPAVIPHLQGIKLYHALLLAENGYRAEAQKYCEAIGSVLKSSNKTSPYFHRTMFNALEELTNRLSQSPKDMISGGWRFDNISGSMWGAFTKFVAGEESDHLSGLDSGVTSSGLVSGQVAMAPGMSSPQSSVDMYASYAGVGGASGGHYSPTASKPITTYVHQQQQSYATHPASSGNLHDPSSSYSPYNPVPNAHYPVTLPPSVPQSPYAITAAHEGGYTSPEKPALRSNFGLSSSHQASSDSPFQDKQRIDDKANGYQSVSYAPTTTYSYEPFINEATSQPTETSSTSQEKESRGETPKAKKKSFLDDDDDDADFLARVAALKKEEEEKRKKQEEERKKQGAASGGGRWFSNWFSRKDPSPSSGAVEAKLGEESSFYYDPELKRWVNKKAASEDPTTTKATLPPPKHPPRPGSAAAPPPSTPSSRSPLKSQSVPPAATAFPPPTSTLDSPSTPISTALPIRVGTPGGPPMRAVTPSAQNVVPSRLGTPTLGIPGTPASSPPPSTLVPPSSRTSEKKPPLSRPATVVGSGDILDDLMGGPAGRKGPSLKKGKKGSRYVDVMAK